MQGKAILAVVLTAILFVLGSAQGWADKSEVRIEAPDKAAKGTEILIKLNVSHRGNNLIHHTEWLRLDINGLKVQAIANNPSRRPADQADIEAWMQLDGARLAWDRIREYFDLFGFSDLCAEMESRCAYNAFIGRVRREFRPIVDRVMKPQGRRS